MAEARAAIAGARFDALRARTAEVWADPDGAVAASLGGVAWATVGPLCRPLTPSSMLR